jgi:MFS family permease
MLAVLRNRTYRHLFAAQVVALLGTGLATVALSLLAFDLAGANAGAVLATALTIKMVSYVTLAPFASAVAQTLPRRVWLVGLDLIRAAVALALPFVSEVWHIYVLIFLLQASSAGFTPVFQATIPDVVKDEDDYTQALSLSRLAYDLESLVSPILAAALLAFVAFDTLFFGTAAGFLASGLLVASVSLPAGGPPAGSVWQRSRRGIDIYLKTPRLRGLLGLSMAAAATGSMVLVNTVVVIRSDLGLGENTVALALAAFGGGSMAAALLLPRVLRRASDRAVMMCGAAISAIALLSAALANLSGPSLPTILAAWACAGAGYSAVFTPAGRLLTRSCQPADRPAVFAAQFTLSHLCWLFSYPLAGWLMSRFGLIPALTILPLIALASLGFALRQWPSSSSGPVPHEHPDLPPDHPHLTGDHPHSHPIVIDDLHPRIPFPPRP